MATIVRPQSGCASVPELLRPGYRQASRGALRQGLPARAFSL